jgi:hypothetical protein
VHTFGIGDGSMKFAQLTARAIKHTIEFVSSVGRSRQDRGLIPLSAYEPDHEISFKIYSAAFGRSFAPQVLVLVELKDSGTRSAPKRSDFIELGERVTDFIAALRAGNRDRTIQIFHEMLS